MERKLKKMIRRIIEMKQRWMMPLVIVLLVMSLSACAMGNDQDRDTANNTTTNTTDGQTNHTATNDNVVNNNDDVRTTNEVPNANSANRKLSIATEVADDLAALEQVKSANVLVTENTAFVGVDLENNMDASDKLQTEITNIVRESGNYNEVFVSFNPDFTKQLADYSDRINNNEPVEGFFDEFKDAVKRMFPNASV